MRDFLEVVVTPLAVARDVHLGSAEGGVKIAELAQDPSPMFARYRIAFPYLGEPRWPIEGTLETLNDLQSAASLLNTLLKGSTVEERRDVWVEALGCWPFKAGETFVETVMDLASAD